MSFPKPDEPRHIHVATPRRPGQIGESRCATCGWPLKLVLETLAVVEIVRPDVPAFFTTWRTPRTTEVARG
jgi:hypothetical protein